MVGQGVSAGFGSWDTMMEGGGTSENWVCWKRESEVGLRADSLAGLQVGVL